MKFALINTGKRRQIVHFIQLHPSDKYCEIVQNQKVQFLLKQGSVEAVVKDKA